MNCLPTVSLKLCFDPWHVKGKVLHHPFSPKGILDRLSLAFLVCSAALRCEFYPVPVSLWLAVSTELSQTLRGLCPAILLPVMDVTTGSRVIRGMHLLLRYLDSFSQSISKLIKKKMNN